MIDSLKGTIHSIALDHAVVVVGGIGYRVIMPTRSLEVLGPAGGEIFVQTHLVVRPDELALYGFTSPEDLRLFVLLTNVNGVGPRQALRLLSVWDANQIAAAIANDDTTSIAKAPGIGKKTAARIILELKPVLDKEWTSAEPGGPPTTAVNDAVAALLALGYTRSEAQAALSSVDDVQSLTLAEQVSSALQKIGSN